MAYSSKFLGHLSKTSAVIGGYELASVLGVSKAAGAQRASGETNRGSPIFLDLGVIDTRWSTWVLGPAQSRPHFHLMMAPSAPLFGKLVLPCLPGLAIRATRGALTCQR